MKQVALFRAINVAGSNVIAMTKLIGFAEQLEYTNCKTILQSGNLLFDHTDRVLEDDFESELSDRLHLQTDVMLRSAVEWQQIITQNPFPDLAVQDPSHLLVMFLKHPADASACDSLRAAIVGPEQVQLLGRELYVSYPDGIGRSKLTNKLIEKHLGASCTGRNWNTVLKISALLQGDGPPKAASVKPVGVVAAMDDDGKKSAKLSRKRSRP